MQLKKITTYTSKNDSLKTSLIKIWEHKSLIWVFAKRDLQVKYTQTILGYGWSILKPLSSLAVYVFFFGYILDWKTGDIPYSIYVLSGLVGWNLFSYIVSNGVIAVHESSDIIKKIYFPKSILPLSKTLVGLVETLISVGLLVPLLIYYDVSINIRIFILPLAVVYNIICGLAITFWAASISIMKRDVLQALPFVLGIFIWLTPVFLSVNIFPEQIQFVFDLNPIANVVELWRWMLFDEIIFKWIWAINFVTTFVIMLIGYYVYSLRESKFADYL